MRWLEYMVFLALVIGLAWPVGIYLARVFERKPTFLDPVLRPIESLLYGLFGIRGAGEMTAGVYTVCFLLFSAVSTAGLGICLVITSPPPPPKVKPPPPPEPKVDVICPGAPLEI